MRTLAPYVCPFCSSRLPRAASRCFFCEHPLPVDKGRTVSNDRQPTTARTSLKTLELPRVYIPAEDFVPLRNIARMAMTDETVSKLLLSELDRAIVCGENLTPHGIVRMGSAVFVQNKGRDGTVEKIRGILVYPEERSNHLPSIPVSSPLGAAILGLNSGDIMPYATGAGMQHVATIERVMPFKANSAARGPTNAGYEVLA